MGWGSDDDGGTFTVGQTSLRGVGSSGSPKSRLRVLGLSGPAFTVEAGKVRLTEYSDLGVHGVDFSVLVIVVGTSRPVHYLV